MDLWGDASNRRIILIDDDRDVHLAYRQLLQPRVVEDLSDIEEQLFGESDPVDRGVTAYELDSAYQGEQGYQMVKAACENENPYALALVDMRMPPGWDGVQTIKKMWEADPDLLVVLVTAYSDHSWRDVVQKLGATDGFLVLKKPFEPIELRQIAASLTTHWNLAQRVRRQMSDLVSMVNSKMGDIEATRRNPSPRAGISPVVGMRLRAPVASVQAMVERLQATEMTELQEEYLELIRHAINQISAISAMEWHRETYRHASADAANAEDDYARGR